MKIDDLLHDTYGSKPVPRLHAAFASRVIRKHQSDEAPLVARRPLMRVYWSVVAVISFVLLWTSTELAGLAVFGIGAILLMQLLRLAGWDLVRLIRVSLCVFALSLGALPMAAGLGAGSGEYRAVAMLDGKIVWSSASSGAPITYRVYSVAKPWTAAAAARLAEVGKLDPDAAVQKYVPVFPEKPEGTITAMQLATHTSGIRHYREDEASMSDCRDVSSTIAAFGDDPLLFVPGTRQSYSTWGFVLLSAVVEGASGQSFPDAMQELVFARAGMTDTKLGDDVRCKWGGGGFVSTPEDLARFYDALLHGRLLSPPMTRLVLNARNGEVSLGGSGGAGRAQVLVDVERRIVVVVAVTSSDPEIDLATITRDIRARVVEGTDTRD